MLETASYQAQQQSWPHSGQCILAHYDSGAVVVYQAYNAEIADFAVREQRFGGPFKMGRMTWIKPNFLWMMYRSNWARSEGQEHILAIRIKRAGFDAILAAAVHSSFGASPLNDHEQWRQRLGSSDVRLQWDPDHGPAGQKLERRAIQLGLRGAYVERYVRDWTIAIEDITPFVVAQRHKADLGQDFLSPQERLYYPEDPDIAPRIGLDVSCCR